MGLDPAETRVYYSPPRGIICGTVSRWRVVHSVRRSFRFVGRIAGGIAGMSALPARCGRAALFALQALRLDLLELAETPRLLWESNPQAAGQVDGV